MAYWVYTTAGDLAYATSSSAIARLAVGTPAQVLRVNSAGNAPEWGGLINDIDMVDFQPAGQSFSSATWEDITGATMTLTLTSACTIIVMAVVTGYNASVGRSFYVRANVNGTADSADSTSQPFNGGQARNEGLPYVYRATGVPSGSRIVKLQCQRNNDPNVVERGRLLAVALVE